MNDKGGEQELRIIGRPVPREDAREKAFGLTSFAADFSMPGMLIGKVLRSPYASAKIHSIDTAKARKLKGIKAVVTAGDVPKNESRSMFPQPYTQEVWGKGMLRVLADRKVHFIGEPVALVAGETEEIAESALKLIKVEYEPLPGVFDPIAAMRSDAPQVEDGKSNIVTHYEIRKGDVEKGFSEADVIVKNKYEVPFVDHAFIEPESGVAWLDENGVVNIRVATQIIEHFKDIADCIGLPADRVRVIGTYVGGAFGGKMESVEKYLALLVYKSGRPVKLTFSRE